MATNPFNTSQLGTEFFDIYNDSVSVARTSIPQLPGGACNFVDLTPGASASRCGCRRFWARQAQGSPVMGQSGWCMCNHHACYHDDGSRDMQQAEFPITTAGQENERPRTARDPLSPMLDMDIKAIAPMVPKTDFPSFGGGSQLSFLRKSFDGGTVIGFGPSPQPGASMPDTLAWADLIQSQPDANGLPPIPPQCLMPSQATSTTSSIQAKYLRPFAGKGLHTLNAAVTTKQISSQMQTNMNTIATTSQPKAPSTEDSFVFVTPEEETLVRPGTASTQVEPRASAESSMSRETLRNLTDVVNTHAQRLDRIETVSFSAANHEECIDRHDQLDLRVAELESKIEEVEKMALCNDEASHRGAYRQDDDATTHSMISAVSTATSRPSHSQEIYSQLQSLQAQVSQLQSVMPSPNHAWEVEVVFLPFPLRKVWQHIHQFKDAATSNGDDWTQLPMTHSTSTMRAQSPFLGEWTTHDNDVEWLLPRACSDKSITDRRLRSRGLVKKVSVSGPDARSVQTAINAAFGSVFHDMQMRTRPHGASSRMAKFMGLQSSWVPLRKIHKDSRLRFLSPDEMLTPAIWSVQFLNSVMMRAAEPRLFVTHPDAYLQDYQAYETGWTWQKLKEAMPSYPDCTESQEVPEVDELEECWTWNEQLDETPGVQMSGSHRQERHRVSISPSVAYFPAVQSWRSTNSVVPRAQTPIVQSLRASRPPHTRTSSVPIPAAAQGSSSVSNPKRRAVSNGQSRRSTPNAQVTIQGGIVKRRRTRSPSHPRFTPGWTASPSPMPMGDRQAPRGTTPFAYATPYSNAPFQPVRGSSIMRNATQYISDDGDEDDEDYEMQLYESGSDESFSDAEEDGDSIASAQAVTHVQQPSLHDSQSFPLPEDEPWPGIEGGRSDGENIDPQHVDPESDASSQPSEYPSTQSAWPGDGNGTSAGFQIHEDDEDDNDDDEQ
ncbi:hypothetical protein PT974_05770 [Cladobotryum mycophilum]|uniref:Uncharacterized protein n=1 Tax=Cladobotryum mycophilum TaxID=491253 RepID=A0ABR0SJP4_9HYPO